MCRVLEFAKHVSKPWASLVPQLVKNLPAMRETGSIPGLGRSPGEGKGCPLQNSGLENSKPGLTFSSLQPSRKAGPRDSYLMWGVKKRAHRGELDAQGHKPELEPRPPVTSQQARIKYLRHCLTLRPWLSPFPGPPGAEDPPCRWPLAGSFTETPPGGSRTSSFSILGSRAVNPTQILRRRRAC